MSDSDHLFAAVRAGRHEEVREILRRSPESAAARDAHGATALHYATERGDRELVMMLLDAGAKINARDSRFDATPAGWAIEYLRQRGGLLAMEIEDLRHAIASGDEGLVQRYLSRLPALREAVDHAGVSLETHAKNSGNRGIARLFGIS